MTTVDPRVTEGQAHAAQERARLAHDPHRPRYHVLPPSGWMNDPNGLIHHGGLYHVFYQHNPDAAQWGHIQWGHAVSQDLVHWQDWPIALSPTPGTPDEDGCWSGCAFMDGDTPAIIYTGGKKRGEQHEQLPCLAHSHDGLLSFEKYAGNPLVAAPPTGLDVVGFRDHRVWREGEAWCMLVGSGVRGVGGAALLYRSANLTDWTYLGPLLQGDRAALDPLWTGEMWECADFFPLGDRHALLISVFAEDPTTFYYPALLTGRYADFRFVPDATSLIDLGGHVDLPRRVPRGERPAYGMHAGQFYAPQTFDAPDGRRLMFGWIGEARTQQAQLDAGWAGVLSLPRALSLDADGALRQEPAAELQALRGDEVRFADLTLADGAQLSVDGVSGRAAELDLRLRPTGARRLTLAVRCAPDGREQTLIVVDFERAHIGVDRRHASLDPGVQADPRGGPFVPQADGTLELRVFIDASVLEIFVNRRSVLTSRVYPTLPDSLGLWLRADGGSAQLEHLSAWTLESAWENPA